MKFFVCALSLVFYFLATAIGIAQTAFYVAPNGSDSNPGTLSAPFATLEAARNAMENSSTKITYIRAGSYQPAADSAGDGTQALYLSSADSGQTWSYYPPDGVASAVIDGGASSPWSGLQYGIYVGGATNVTINGLQLQNFAKFFLDATNGASGTQFINNVLHDTYNGLNDAGVALWGSAPGSVVAHNYIYNTANHGILASTCNGGCAGGMTGITIAYNVIDTTCMVTTDCGAIYIEDYASPRSTGITVSQNFLHDMNPSSDTGRGVYLDDGASNVTATDNIVAGNKWTCFNIHGGDNNVFSNNVCDEEANNDQYILTYQVSDSSSLRMVNNVFSNNIIIAGSSGGGGGYNGDSAPNPATIDNNLYFNYVGDAIYTSGSGGSGSDSNPTYADPQLSSWCYTVGSSSPAFNSPINFSGIEQGWGPPGFVIPTAGTPPSSPHGSGCGNANPVIAFSAAPAAISAGQSSTLSWSSTDSDGCSSPDFATGNSVSGSASVSPSTTTTYSLTCTGSGGSKTKQTVVTVGSTSAEAPYGGTPWAIPGKIEADNYDVGGNGIAYYTTATGNQGGDYRNDDIGIQATTDTATCVGLGCGYDVGWTAAGEWLNYMVNVANSGTYRLAVRVADAYSGASLHVEVDGNRVARFSVPNTGGWQNWTTIGKKISLSAGSHIVRIVFDADDGGGYAGSIHWIHFVKKS